MSELGVMGELLSELGARAPSEVLRTVLAAARRHLAMDVAFVAETDGTSQTFRAVDGDASVLGLVAGATARLEETFCGWILRGALPNVIADAQREPAAAELAAALPGIGSYVGVPVMFNDGRLFGVLACVGARRAPWLDDSDEKVLRVLADIIGSELEARHLAWEEHCRELLAARHTATDAPPTIVVQPIEQLSTRALVGAEALARFPGTDLGPDEVFRRAWRLGYGPLQEHAAVAAALGALEALPAHVFISINVSPRLPSEPGFEALFEDVDLARVVLELTEHSRMDDPQVLLEQVSPLRRQGLRIAIDDAGAGFAGLDRIIQLEPDIIKLDAALVRGILGSGFRAALVSSFVAFGSETGTQIVAEGVETPEELATLLALGIDLGQGWLLGHPVPANEVRDGYPG